jgi:hypothetical protein
MKTTGVAPEVLAESISLLSRSEIVAVCVRVLISSSSLVL